MNWSKLRKYLDLESKKMYLEKEILNDAIEPALKFKNPRDIEFSAFICAIFAYGNIKQIKRNLNQIFLPMGPNPVNWLITQNKFQFQDWKHRFNTEDDLVLLLKVLKKIYTDFSSIEEFVGDSKSTFDFIQTLSEKMKYEGSIISNKQLTRSFKFLFSEPSKKSACKRLNLYLRWMVGTSHQDFGLWKKLSPSQLMVPLDTHIHKQAKSLNWTKRNSADWKTAEEITLKLKKLDPMDPVKYDFVLCHLSIKGQILKAKDF